MPPWFTVNVESRTKVLWALAAEDIGVLVYQSDTEGIVCSSNAGTSYSGTRYQTFANCQLMEEGSRLLQV